MRRHHGFLPPWCPRCERPGRVGLAGSPSDLEFPDLVVNESLLPTGLASTPWLYPIDHQQTEWLETYWSEWLQITSWPLGFNEQQTEWLESASVPDETDIPWPERLSLTFCPNGPQQQSHWMKASWPQAAFQHQFEGPELTRWAVQPQEQEAEWVEDALFPEDTVPWPERLVRAHCPYDPQDLFPQHLGEPPWSL